MAYAMMGGIIVGTLLTLFVLASTLRRMVPDQGAGATEVAGCLPGADSEPPAGGVGGGCGYDLDPRSMHRARIGP